MAEPSDHRAVMRGFPPPPEWRITLDNWDKPPFNRWSFRNIRRVLPTAPVGTAQPAGTPEKQPETP